MAGLVLEPVAQLVDQLLVARVLHLEVVEPPQRCVDRGQTGVGVLRVRPGRRDDAHRSNQPGQGEPLADQCREDDAEGQEDDEIPVGEHLGVRQGQGGCQRDARHACPPTR